MYDILIEAHVGAWEAALLLAVAGYILYRIGNTKIARPLHMILRLMYVLIVGSGLWMLIQFHSTDLVYYLKGLLGIVAVGLLEMSLVRASQQRPSAMPFLAALVVLILVILIGYRVIL